MWTLNYKFLMYRFSTNCLFNEEFKPIDNMSWRRSCVHMHS